MNERRLVSILRLLCERLVKPVHIRLAEGGFGCSPTASGRAVYATCLGDGEQTRWNREDFTGVLDGQYLPGWAQEKLDELQTQKPSDPVMGGMA